MRTAGGRDSIDARNNAIWPPYTTSQITAKLSPPADVQEPYSRTNLGHASQRFYAHSLHARHPCGDSFARVP